MFNIEFMFERINVINLSIWFVVINMSYNNIDRIMYYIYISILRLTVYYISLNIWNFYLF
jgi:hypothetical protein